MENNKVKLTITKKNIVNVHCHLPLISDELYENYTSGDHSLLPSHLIDDIIAQLNPDTFFSDFEGMSGIYAIEKHNLFGKACPIFSPNDYVLDLAKKYPKQAIPFASVNMKDPQAPTKINDLLHQGFAGIKYHALEGYSLFHCGDALSEIEKQNIPLVVHLGDTPFPKVDLSHADPKQLISIANKFPNLRMLITHFGTPLHLSAFWVASRYDSIYLDTAEFPVYWTPSSENPYGPLLSPLHTKRIGHRKILFGTDFPMPTLKHNKNTGEFDIGIHKISDYIRAFENLPHNYFTEDEREDILCNNVWKFLGKTKKEIISQNCKI